MIKNLRKGIKQEDAKQKLRSYFEIPSNILSSDYLKIVSAYFYYCGSPQETEYWVPLAKDWRDICEALDINPEEFDTRINEYKSGSGIRNVIESSSSRETIKATNKQIERDSLMTQQKKQYILRKKAIQLAGHDSSGIPDADLPSYFTPRSANFNRTYLINYQAMTQEQKDLYIKEHFDRESQSESQILDELEIGKPYFFNFFRTSGLLPTL